jgi:CBS domain-containing protein
MVTVSEAMTPHVRTISPEATLAEAARLMRKFNIGSLVVVEEGRAIGIVTERDLAYKIVAEERSPLLKVREVMSRDLKFISRDASLKEAAKKMAAHAIKRLLVGSEEKLEGIITTTDLVRAERIGEDPRSYSFT